MDTFDVQRYITVSDLYFSTYVFAIKFTWNEMNKMPKISMVECLLLLHDYAFQKRQTNRSTMTTLGIVDGCLFENTQANIQ